MVLLFPVWFVYGWIRQELDDAGVTKPSVAKDGPGVISVAGSRRSSAPTSLIDTIKRAPRSLWIVVSHSRLAVVVAGEHHNVPRVVWQTDETATVRFQHAVQNSIHISWPDQSRAYFYPTSWDDQR